jgi:glycosyltransferase involved in cell wall biosynthesis
VKILIATPLWPNSHHTVRGGNIIIFEMIRLLAGQPGVEVVVQKVSRPDEVPPDEHERASRKILAGKPGITVLDEYRLEDSEIAPRRADRWRILTPQIADYYPVWPGRERWQKHLQEQKPDAVLIPLSEWITALTSDFPGKTFAYYGNPDPKSRRRRDDFSLEQKRIGLLEHSKRRVDMAHLERIHLDIMRGISHCGNVSLNDAQYYTAKGHPNAFYIPHLWTDAAPTARAFEREPKPVAPIRVIANIGKLDATANRDGLLVLADQMLPHFRVGECQWEILGANKLDHHVLGRLQRSDVMFRGWVPNIDEEMASAQVFLCLNNASPYKVGHTRYLHAMSLGCCIVAHQDVRLSMPELVHRENCLLGSTVAEVAGLLREAALHPALRSALGRGAVKTFREKFTGQAVVPQIVSRLQG